MASRGAPMTDLDRREGAPATLALEDPEQTAEQGERHRRHSEQGGHQQVVELQGGVDQRGERQQDDAEYAGGDQGQPDELWLEPSRAPFADDNRRAVVACSPRDPTLTTSRRFIHAASAP